MVWGFCGVAFLLFFFFFKMRLCVFVGIFKNYFILNICGDLKG